MIESHRLLALAFTCADLLFEVNFEGDLVFATGATKTLTQRPEGDLIGYSAAKLFRPADAAQFMTFVKALRSGQRLGPTMLALATGEFAELSMFRLPSNLQRISCTLALSGARRFSFNGSIDPQTGLADPQAFLSTAESAKSEKGVLALVNLPNLPEIVGKLSAAEAQALFAHIGETVKSLHATAAGRLSETCFAVLADDSKSAETLATNIHDAAVDDGILDLHIDSVVMPLDAPNLTREQMLLAMRHVVERLADTEFSQTSNTNMVQVFNALVTETLERAMNFKKAIADDAFRIVFEPVVDLKNGKTAHFEVLTRFAQDKPPAEMIQLAEAIGIVDALDLAVTAKVFAALDSEPKSDYALAVNISGHTIATPSSFALFLGILQNKQSYAKRILIEVTESAEIRDLGSANAAIQSIRKMGYRVGIDDFGAGAASLQYLHNLEVDFVKFDGSLIRRLGESNRQDTLFRGLVDTCAKLGIKTTAEWIEDHNLFKRAKEIGCCLGQGRYFGETLQSISSVSGNGGAASTPKQARKAG
jgi:EAL domain-containing protein (putative c-di-GMP-specific phosphodiesterase class I)